MERILLFLLSGVVSMLAPVEADAKDKAATLPAGVRLIHALKAPNGQEGRAIVFADKGRLLVTTTAEGMQAWEVSTGERKHTWPGSFAAITASPDGALLAAIDLKTDVHIYDVSTRRQQWQFHFSGVKPKDSAWDNDTAVLSFSPDGKRMAVGCFQDVEIWDVPQRKLAHRFQRQTGWRFGILDFFPDSARLVCTGFPTYMAEIWDARAAKRERMMLLMKYVRAAKLAPDGGTLAAGLDFGASSCGLYIFPADKRGRYRVAGTHSPTNNVAYSPDGRVLAVRFNDSELHLLHFKSLQVVDKLTVASAGDSSLPLGLAFSPDNNFLALDNGKEILLWSLQDWNKKLRQYEVLSPERLEKVWQELASEHEQFRHPPPTHQLLAVPDQAVPFLAQKLKPVPRPNPDYVNKLIRELDNEQFTVRDKAIKALRALDWLAKPTLTEALAKETTLETKRRIVSLLQNMTPEWSPEHWRPYRAVDILSEIDTEPARQILRDLAAGAPGAYLTQQALRRLKEIEDRKAQSPQ